MSPFQKAALSTSLTVSIMFTVTPIFMNIFGENLLVSQDSGHVIYKEYSRLIYFIASFIGQLIYSLTTKISGGCIILPIFSGLSVSRKIHSECMKASSSPLINTLICLSLSCVTAGTTALVLSRLSIVRYIEHIPLTLITAIMLSSGFDLIALSIKLYENENKFIMGCFLVLSLLITIYAIHLHRKTKNPVYLLFYILLLSFSASIFCFLTKKNVYWGCKIFLNKKTDRLFLSNLYSAIDFSAISWKTIASQWISIIELGILPLINLIINLPAYSNTVGVSFSFVRELQAFGLSNIYSAMAPFPVYFNCSGSSMFHISGGDSRLYTFLAGLTYILIYFFFHYITRIIPVFVYSLLTQFMGISFVISYGMILRKSSLLDAVIVLASTLLLVFYRGKSLILIMLFVPLYELFIAFLYTNKINIKNVSMEALHERDTSKFIISGLLNFFTISEIIRTIQKDAGADSKEIMIDLRSCLYIDMTANIGLETAIKRMRGAGIEVRILGNPANFYSRMYRKVGVSIYKLK